MILNRERISREIVKFESCNLGGLAIDKDPVSKILVGWNHECDKLSCAAKYH